MQSKVYVALRDLWREKTVFFSSFRNLKNDF